MAFNDPEVIYIEGGSATDTLIIDDLVLAADIIIKDDRVVIFRNVNASPSIVTSTPDANGDIYIEGSSMGNFNIHNCNVWARSINIETTRRLPNSIIFINNDDLVNDNGSLWVLCNKSEGKDCIYKTINGGKTEVFNFTFHSHHAEDPTVPVFIVEDADLSLVSLKREGGQFYDCLIEHTTAGSSFKVNEYDLLFSEYDQ